MKKSFIIVSSSLAIFFFLTTLASAQTGAESVRSGMTTFAGLIKTFNETVVQALGALFMSGAVVAFFYGLARFIWGLREGETKSISNGKQFMIWSITALFVMFSIYGIIKFFQGLVPGLNQNTISIPTIVAPGGSSGTGVGSGGTSGSGNSTGVGSGGTSGSGNSTGVESGGTSGAGGGVVGDTSSGQVGIKVLGEQCTFDNNCISGYCLPGPYGSQCATRDDGIRNGMQ